MKVFDRAYQFYNGLPGWGKAVAVIGGTAITWFGIINPLRKAIINKLDQAKLNKTVNEFKDDLTALKKQGIHPTYTDAQYKGWADQITNAFSGCDWSQTVDTLLILPTAGLSAVASAIFGRLSGSGKTLYAVLANMKNDADFVSLVTAFGTRTYDQCGFWVFAGNITANLYKAVDDELTTSEIGEMNSLLASKNIHYKF